MKYYALHGLPYSPGETGWVLIVDGASPAIEPQAITVQDVVGDLSASVKDEDVLEGMLFVVRTSTESMIGALETGNVAASKHDGEPSPADRLLQLGEELAQSFPPSANR
jgi:hypothetical protein